MNMIYSQFSKLHMTTITQRVKSFQDDEEEDDDWVTYFACSFIHK